MKYGNIIECNVCKSDMIKDGNYLMSTDKKKVDGDVILIKSICCPTCGARYPYSVTDKQTRRLIRKRNVYIKSIIATMQAENLRATDDKIDRMLAHNRELGREINKHIDMLRIIYLGGETNGKE